MDALVLDVSACMPWCCEDEATPASEKTLAWAIAGSVLHVPCLWPWEMMNAVAIAVRRQRITAERAGQFFEQIATFNSALRLRLQSRISRAFPFWLPATG